MLKRWWNRNITILSKFFVSSTGSRHLRDMKTSTNDENPTGTIKAPSNFSEMVNGHFNNDSLYITTLCKNSLINQIKSKSMISLGIRDSIRYLTILKGRHLRMQLCKIDILHWKRALFLMNYSLVRRLCKLTFLYNIYSSPKWIRRQIIYKGIIINSAPARSHVHWITLSQPTLYSAWVNYWWWWVQASLYSQIHYYFPILPFQV